MVKIIAAVEPIDPNTGFPLLNMADPNYYKEGSEKPYPLTFGKHMFNELKHAAYTPYINAVDYVSVDKITSKNYLYIVDIFSTTFFVDNEKYGFKFVSPKILEDVRSGYCQIVFSNTTEGMSGIKGIAQEFDFKIIENWCHEYNIPTNLVHYIHGNMLSKEIATSQGCTYNVYPVTVQECWNNIYSYPNTIPNFEPNVTKPYLYLNYNRQPRLHRVLLLSMLLKDDLFKFGMNSFNHMDRSAEWFEPIFKNLGLMDYFEDVKYLFDNSPIIVDTDNSDITSSVGSIENYEQTFMSIVTETLMDSGTLFCSEKTWRSIIVGHPFVILAGKGMLQYLRSQGFKTFSNWINEDYDDCDDWIQRIRMVKDEIARLSKLPIEDLKSIRKEMEPILQHNKEVMRRRVDTKFNKTDNLKPIEDILKKIVMQNPFNKGKDNSNI